jgi:hypothetical protein
MPCKVVKHSDGSSSIVCSRIKRNSCAHCGAFAPLLCDFILPHGKTCDLPICHSCSIHVVPGKDYCLIHTQSGKVIP